MAIKHWIREGGKGYFIGPEEDMYHETDMECDPRPSEDYSWKDGKWVLDLELQRMNNMCRAKEEWNKVQHYQYIEMSNTEEEQQRKHYLSQLAKACLGEAQIPQKPKFIKANNG